MEEDLKKLAEQDTISKSNEFNTLNIQLLARTEAVSIVAYILNAYLNVHQKTKNKLTEEEIKAINSAISEVNKETAEIMNKMTQLAEDIISKK